MLPVAVAVGNRPQALRVRIRMLPALDVGAQTGVGVRSVDKYVRDIIQTSLGSTPETMLDRTLLTCMAISGIPIIVLSSTSGEKTVAFVMKKSVHGGKSGYAPLVSVAKEACVKSARYDAAGEKGLLAWLECCMNK